jgi:N-acyl-D-amino-acid deacylase
MVGPGLEAIDEIMLRQRDRRGIPGIGLAVARQGRLVVARGYGYADILAQQPVHPTTPFLLASVSKVFTAQSVLKLVDAGRLPLDAPAFSFVRDLEPPRGMSEDPRLEEITVRMLLNHTGGWDRRTSGDPNAWGPRVRRALHLDHPPTMWELIRYMKGVPLDFDPGTRAVYSNFGFDLLGAILERVLGEPYEAAVRHTTLGPLGVERPRLDLLPPRYLPGEARRYAPGGEHEFPGGHLAMVAPSGGWVASPVDLLRLMTGIDGTRTGQSWLGLETTQAMLTRWPGVQPRPDGSYFGLGWDRVMSPAAGAPAGAADGSAYLRPFEFGKDGGVTGISTWVAHLPLPDGSTLVWALLLNISAMHEEAPPIPAIAREVLEVFRTLPQWPDVDYFERFQ